ncbi:MAG: hypothetical protein P8077_09030 [Gammaproteobacteria bacterium]
MPDKIAFSSDDVVNKAFSFIHLQYCKEAAFLWRRRFKVVDAPYFSFHDLMELDERMVAQLSGLSLSGLSGWEVAFDAWRQFSDPSDWFVAAYHYFCVMSVDKGLPDFDDFLGYYLQGLTHEKIKAMRAASLWVPEEHRAAIDRFIAHLNLCRETEARVLALVLRSDKMDFESLRSDDDLKAVMTLADDANPEQLEWIMQVIAQEKAVLCQPLVSRCLRDSNPLVAFSATIAQVFLSPEASLPYLARFAQNPNCYQAKALDLWMRLMPIEHSQRVMSQLEIEPDSLLHIQACAARGSVRDVPALLKHMNEEKVSRAAGEAFSLITGINLYQNERFCVDHALCCKQNRMALERDQCDNSEDPFESLPWPNPAALATWWQQQKDKFDQDGAYLCGKPRSRAALYQLLKTGYQRQRHAAALCLNLCKGFKLSMSTAWPSARQRVFLDNLNCS